jgi:uncharacterized coiled-coil protein SlyX
MPTSTTKTTGSPKARRTNYARIASGLHELENDVAKQAAALAGISTEVGSLKNSISEIKDAIQLIADKQNKGSNWGVLGTWGAVIITLVGGLGYLALIPLQDDLAENRDSILQSNRDFVAHIQDGHPQMVLDKMADLRDEVEENEREALREMQETTAQMTAMRAAKDAEIKTMINYEAELTDAKLAAAAELREAKLAHHEDLIAANSAGVTDLDSMLQREMRLLDEILQREMGLNVDRLEALSTAGSQASKERHDLQATEISTLRAMLQSMYERRRSEASGGGASVPEG